MASKGNKFILEKFISNNQLQKAQSGVETWKKQQALVAKEKAGKLKKLLETPLVFKTKEEKERAKAALRAAGIKIGSEYRHGDPGYHGKGLAIDVPGNQWGGGPRNPITGAHYVGSKKVREVLGLRAFEKGGKTPGVPTPAIVGEKGPEFVLDTDTTTALEQNFPGFLVSLNKADYKGTLQVLQNYASYHNPSGTTLMMQRVIIEKPIPIQSKGGGFIPLDNSTSSSNPTAVLHKG